jgi:hypothetical protein
MGPAGFNQSNRTTTSVQVTASSNSATAGQLVTLTITVISSVDAPTGNVELFDGSTDLGPAGILTGSGTRAMASFTTDRLGFGSHTIRAVFTATDAFLGSTGTFTLMENAATRVVVTASAAPSLVGRALTFTATVIDVSGGPTPIGSIQFFDGTTRLGSGTLVRGSGPNAVFTFAAAHLTLGDHVIRAMFAPSAHFAGSSGALTETIIADILAGTHPPGSTLPYFTA